MAHNGLMFDMRVLYFELKRYGFLEKNMGIPKDVSISSFFFLLKRIPVLPVFPLFIISMKKPLSF